LYKAASLITVRDDKDKVLTAGAALGTYDNIAHASDIISLIMIQNGADLNDLAGPKKKEAVDALSYYSIFATGKTKVWDDTMENSKLAFAKGKVAMYIGYSWDIFEIKAINPDLQFAITAVPQVLEGETTVASYWVEGISNKTPHLEEAFEFLKFLATKESLQKLYSIQARTRPFGELYPRSDMAELLKDNTLVYPFVQQGSSAQSTMFSSDTYDDRMVDDLNKYLGDAVRSVVNDNGSAESAIESLAQGVSEKLEQYGAKSE
jgi:multiple sugar transport system substrate-binding protein